MTSMTSSSCANAAALELEPGRMVRTPIGHFAEVKAIYMMAEGHAEVLVEYPEGERARFRAGHLRPLP